MSASNWSRYRYKAARMEAKAGPVGFKAKVNERAAASCAVSFLTSRRRAVTESGEWFCCLKRLYFLRKAVAATVVLVGVLGARGELLVRVSIAL